MIVFDSQKGRVISFTANTNATVPALLSFPGFDYTTLQLITANLQLSFKPIYQVTDSLGDDVYIVSFGESVTPFNLAGLVFEDSCDFASGGEGIASLIEWWEQQNLLNQNVPARLTLGKSFPITAYVADMQISVASADDRIWKFELLLLRIPPRVFKFAEPTRLIGLQQQPDEPDLIDPNIEIEQFQIPPGGYILPGQGGINIRSDGSPTIVQTVSLRLNNYTAPQALLGQLTSR